MCVSKAQSKMAGFLEQLKQVYFRVFPSEAGKGQIGSIEFNIWLSQMSGVPLSPWFVPLRRSQLVNVLLLIYGSVFTFTNFCYILFEFYDLYICWPDFYAFTQNFCLTMSHFAGALKVPTIYIFTYFHYCKVMHFCRFITYYSTWEHCRQQFWSWNTLRMQR